MKRKNYKWKFAISLMPLIGIIFGVLDIVLMIFEGFFCEGNKLNNLLLINVTFICCLIPAFFIFVVVGSIMFKKHSFRQDENAFYQGKRKLEKSNLLKLTVGRFNQIYSAWFIPKKQGIFVSSKLVYYFYNEKEILHFILKNGLNTYLPIKEQMLINNDFNFKPWKKKSSNNQAEYECPCCCNLTFYDKPGGTFDICPVCFWEDDDLSTTSPEQTFDINKVSLNQAKINYKEFGACEKGMVLHVRSPFDNEKTIHSILTNKERGWNELWDRYSKGTLDQDGEILCNYYSGIQGEGYGLYFDNNKENLREINALLKKVLPCIIYQSFERAYKAFTDQLDVEAIYYEEEWFFFSNEHIISDCLQNYANQLSKGK